MIDYVGFSEKNIRDNIKRKLKTDGSFFSENSKFCGGKK